MHNTPPPNMADDEMGRSCVSGRRRMSEQFRSKSPVPAVGVSHREAVADASSQCDWRVTRFERIFQLHQLPLKLSSSSSSSNQRDLFGPSRVVVGQPPQPSACCRISKAERRFHTCRALAMSCLILTPVCAASPAGGGNGCRSDFVECLMTSPASMLLRTEFIHPDQDAATVGRQFSVIASRQAVYLIAVHRRCWRKPIQLQLLTVFVRHVRFFKI